eukprot:6192734-Pleurochrysis_carterae.AAC.4
MFRKHTTCRTVMLSGVREFRSLILHVKPCRNLERHSSNSAADQSTHCEEYIYLTGVFGVMMPFTFGTESMICEAEARGQNMKVYTEPETR